MTKPFDKTTLPFLPAGILLAGSLLAALWVLPGTIGEVGRSILTLAAAGAFLFFQSNEDPRYRTVVIGFLGLIGLYSVYTFSRVYFHLFQAPNEWDFLCYYLDGKAAVEGLNFYLPESYEAVAGKVALPYTPSQDFQSEIIGAGFGLNPPPSMFMFYPLGAFSYSTALAVWISFISLCFVGAIALTVPLFFSEKKSQLAGALFFIAIALLWPPSRKTLLLGQTNFIALLLLMLFWWKAKKPVSGIFAALAMFAKPVLLILPGILLVRGQWKALGFAVGTSVILSILSILAFGMETFLSFFTRLTDIHIATTIFSEVQNQSLTGILMRLGEHSVMASPLFIGFLSILVLGLSAYAVHFTKEKNIGWAICTALTGFLLIYPGTLTHYGVFLLPVIVFFLLEWKTSKEFYPTKAGRYGYLAGVLMVMVLAGSFWANLIAWVISLGISAYKIANLPK